MTIGGARAEGAALLRVRGVGTPELDASLLLAHILGIERTGLLLSASQELGQTYLEAFRKALDSRADGVCVAYLIGHKEFHGLDFFVDPGVLVPRTDTETLVEAALNFLADNFPPSLSHSVRRDGRRPRILDLCTGSGCVAISLAAERPDAFVSACDLSPAALVVARRNAAHLLPGRVTDPDTVRFFLSDLYSAALGRFDLIVSNPPYVPSSVIDGLSAEVRREPRMALDGGEDGLTLIRRIVQESPSWLAPDGLLLVESGSEQADPIAGFMTRAGLTNIRTYQDLAGLDRVTGASL